MGRGNNYIGIDPGLQGGICVLKADGSLLKVMPIPVSREKDRIKYLIPAMVELLKEYRTGFCVLEKAIVIRGQGLCSSASAVGGQRLIEGIVAGLGMRCLVVRSQVWQKTMFVGRRSPDTKVASVRIASRLWPEQSWLRSARSSVPCHGLTDAALLAEFGRRSPQEARSCLE